MATGIFYLSIGAILGAILRFVITHYSSELSHHHGFPFGTLLVNVLGSLLVGYVLTWSADHEHDYWRLFAATGFCGAFTTFSAFAYETLAYWHEGRVGAFVLNLVLNNSLCILAVAWGIRLHNSK
ncbi:MAG: fluoride efflux transporter CrcB [Acidobacteria bacterium]|nr:MAG: fluoride efflux transporter CrcB [Acidobacteriota bacterium]PYX65825.1 MAG: fluoride efflux transporter CrcB [Acidobacteriota bacterium]